MTNLTEHFPSRFLFPSRSSRAKLLVEANMRRYLRHRLLFLTGFLEPFFFLLSIGVGVGGLIGEISVQGEMVRYAVFVAPGLLATSAMNGAMIDSVFNVFFKLKITHTYEAVLATPMTTTDIVRGEVRWAMTRGTIYSAAFIVILIALGDTMSWMVIFCLPVCLLLSYSFAAMGVAATSYMRTWQDFDLVVLVQMPMFLFSGVFFPLSAYPPWLRDIVAVTPLYQGVAACRDFSLGHVRISLLFHVLYLAVVAGVGLVIATKKMTKTLAP